MEARATKQAEDDVAKITKVLIDLNISNALQEFEEKAVSPAKSNATKDGEIVQSRKPITASK